MLHDQHQDESDVSTRADTPAPFSRIQNREQILWHSNPSFKLWHDMPVPDCSDALVKRYIGHIQEQYEGSDPEGCATQWQNPDSLAFQSSDDSGGSSDCATPVKDACIRPFTPEQVGKQSSAVWQDGSPGLSEDLFSPMGKHRAPLPQPQNSAEWLRQRVRASPLSRHLSLNSPPRRSPQADALSPTTMQHLLTSIPKGLTRLRTSTLRDSRGLFSPQGKRTGPFSPSCATPPSHRAARRLKMLHKRTASGPWFEVNLEE